MNPLYTKSSSAYLLDSDVLIWILRGQKKTLELLDSLEGPFYISTISRAEIWAGAFTKEKKKISKLLDSMVNIPVDKKIADRAGAFLRKYGKRGRELELEDMLIAASCVEDNLVLLTYNLSHYRLIKELELYQT